MKDGVCDQFIPCLLYLGTKRGGLWPLSSALLITYFGSNDLVSPIFAVVPDVTGG